MSESLEKELDNMEEVTEGSNVVTKNAKPGEKIDTSKSTDSLGGSGKKVVHVDTDSLEGAAGTKNAGKSAAGSVSVEKDMSSLRNFLRRKATQSAHGQYCAYWKIRRHP